MSMTFFWSRTSGQFVVKKTGIPLSIPGFNFEGTQHEWYETLVETISDCLHEMKLSTTPETQIVAVDVYVHHDVANILKCSTLFKSMTGLSKVIGKITRHDYELLIHEDNHSLSDDVQIIATFNVRNGVSKTMCGSIKVLNMC